MQYTCAILSSVVRPALQYFSTLSHKRHGFLKPVNEQEVCVLIFSANVSETFLIFRGYERNRVKNYVGLNVK
jgi:hypothetical protein